MKLDVISKINIKIEYLLNNIATFILISYNFQIKWEFRQTTVLTCLLQSGIVLP